MKTPIKLLCSLVLGLVLAPGLFAQTTAFTYQGRLNQSNSPARGNYDMQFSLFNVVSGGAAIAGPLSATVTVTDGLFTVPLDFGSAPFTAQNLWLQIAVRTNGVGVYSNLTPRQPLTSSPYAIRALNAGSATTAATATAATTANSVAANGVNNTALQDNAITAAKIASGQVVKSLNGLRDAVTLAAGLNLTLTPSGNTLTLASPTWSLTGNAGTTPGGNFFGASDNAQVRLHATGGFLVDNTTPGISFGNQARQMLNLWSTSYGIGVQAATLYQRTDANFAWHRLGSHADGTGDPGPGGTNLMFLDYAGHLFANAGVTVDNANANTGDYYPGVVFGPGSGESIASKRDAGGNQWGLDFYTGFARRMSIMNNGNVGIGTLTPGYRLDVFDGVNQNGTVHVGGYGANGDPKLIRFGDGDFVHVGELYRDDLLDLKGATISMSSSFVGIGTTTPSANLHLYTPYNPTTMRLQSSGGFGSAALEFWSDPQGSDFEWRPGFIQSTDNGGFTGGLGFYVNGTGYENRQGAIEVMRLVNGNVGIGTAVPSEKLHVNGGFVRVEGYGGEQAYIGGDGFGGDVQIGSFNPGINNVALYNPNNGYMNLYVKSITITGGADLAEPFEMSHKEIPQGAVVVIDEENPGQLKMSVAAYDTRVAGIVSGAGGINPGIQLKQQGALDGGQNVALTGRVYALADATSAPIKPGDLLTTSATPGHCMKAGDRDRAQGAILGKAMTGLKEGQGKVLVLVTLQ